MKEKKIRNNKHLAYVRTLPCIIQDNGQNCNGEYVAPHHLTHISDKGGMGLKTGDNWVVPLCFFHHSALHRIGEKKFWETWCIDAEKEAKKLWGENNVSH